MSTTDTTLGPYVLERELGRGAFGVVYRGHHESRPETFLAIKTVEAQGSIDRLLVEPALLARLKHPCIVGLDDYFVHEGKLVLALEYVPGEDLKVCLDRGDEFPPEQVRELLTQLGSALAEAHAQGVVHRDIKPSNILVDTSGGRTRFVLTDFGIGRRAEGVQAEKHVGGTYLYMAPEQLRGRPAPQSDLWALGVVAYQLLTGKLPFPGPGLADLAKQIQYTDPPAPSEVTGRALPAGLEEAVLGLLRKSLSERTATPAELLRQFGLRGDTKKALEAKTVTKHPTTKAALPISKKLDRQARRALWLLALMVTFYVVLKGVLLGALFVGGLWLFYHAQARPYSRGRRSAWTVLAFVVLALPFGTQISPEFARVLTLGLSDSFNQFAELQKHEFSPSARVFLTVVVVVAVVIALFVPVIASAAYASFRRARREQTLLRSALAGESGSEQFLAKMRDLVDTRFEDVGFHMRYAELLYARGDHRQAAVEARLITVQDPYHFNGNLLLANAYYALTLYADCVRVCDEYLAVAGYCFEFQELRQQCAGRLAPS
jgi:serine/threonine-protein kinase